MQQFFHDRKPIDIIQHCIEQRSAHEQLIVHIGCDSILLDGMLTYVTVIAFRYGKNGAHYVYAKEKVKPYRDGTGKPDIWTKLWREAQHSIDIAEDLVEMGIFSRDNIVIEFDYNNIIVTLSTKLIQSTKGWAMSLGYENVLLKSDAQIAVKAANHVCQHHC